MRPPSAAKQAAAQKRQDQIEAQKQAAAAKKKATADKKEAAKRKKEAAAARSRQRKADLAQRKKERQDLRAQVEVEARLRRDGELAARSKLQPSELWWRRFWVAVRELHPALTFNDQDRDEIAATILPLWRAHKWGPEEAAQAVCQRCAQVGEPAHGGPVASGGKFLAYKVKPGTGFAQEVRRPKPARSSTRSCPTSAGECSYSLEGGRCSIRARLSVPAKGKSGTDKIPARYCLVEIDSLKTSNDPLKGYSPTPGYPAQAQERDYRQKNEQAKVEHIASDYDPALVFNTGPGAIDGIPVATEGKIVLGGNGRTMATALVYAGRGGVPATAPKDFLRDNAEEFGFTAEDVDSFQRPMLVRTIRVGADPKGLADWSRRLNTSLSEQLDPTLMAVSRARFLQDSTIRALAEALHPDDTMASFLGSPRSRVFVRALQTDGVIDARAAAVYIDPRTGLLSEAGQDLVTDLLVAVLIPDATLIRAYGRGPVGVLARGAPYLVMAEALEGYDVSEPLRKAVRDRVTMKAQGMPSVDNLLSQGGLFAGHSAASEGDARAMVLLRVLAALDASPAKFARFARSYAELAASNPSGQAALFAADKIEPLQALQLAAGQAGVELPAGRP